MADLWFALFSATIGLAIAISLAQRNTWIPVLRDCVVFTVQITAATGAGIGFVWLALKL